MRSWRGYSFAGVVCVAMMLVATPALAQETPAADPEVVSGSTGVVPLPDETEVGGEILDPGTGTPVEVAGTGTGTGAGTGTLPFTGGDLAALVVLGVVALGVGGLLVARRRARSALPRA